MYVNNEASSGHTNPSAARCSAILGAGKSCAHSRRVPRKPQGSGAPWPRKQLFHLILLFYTFLSQEDYCTPKGTQVISKLVRASPWSYFCHSLIVYHVTCLRQNISISSTVLRVSREPSKGSLKCSAQRLMFMFALNGPH